MPTWQCWDLDQGCREGPVCCPELVCGWDAACLRDSVSSPGSRLVAGGWVRAGECAPLPGLEVTPVVCVPVRVLLAALAVWVPPLWCCLQVPLSLISVAAFCLLIRNTGW